MIYHQKKSMAISDHPYVSSLPAIIFGTVAVIATMFLDKKVREFKSEQDHLKKLKNQESNEKSIPNASKPKLELELEGEKEEEKTSEIAPLLPHQLPPELDERHVLFVCMRCTYRKSNCENLGACKLENPEKRIIEQDMEELASSPKISESVEAPPLKNGTVLYHRLVQAHGSPSSPTRKHRKVFEIRPTRCLSSCDSGNAIALQGPATKFGYQFANLDHNRPNIAEDILEFVDFYVNSEDGYSKTKMRPPALKSTIVSRIPPKNHYSSG